MNSKIKTLLGLSLLVALLGGAYFAYQALSARNAPVRFVPGPMPTPTDSTKATPVAQQTEEGEADPAEDDGENEYPDAIDFSVYDAEGNTVKLSDFFGKPIIINFWTTWCTYCVEEMPMFEEAWKQYGDQVQFLMIDCVDGQRETQEKGERFIQEKGFSFPVYYDTDGLASYIYSVYSLPTTVFINTDGKVIVYYPSMLTSELLQKGIELILPAE